MAMVGGMVVLRHEWAALALVGALSLMANHPAMVHADRFCGDPPSALVAQRILSAVGFCFFAPTTWQERFDRGASIDEPEVFSAGADGRATLILLGPDPRDFATAATSLGFAGVRAYPGFAVLYPMAPLATPGADVAMAGVASYRDVGVDRIVYSAIGQYGNVVFLLTVDLASTYLGQNPTVGRDMLGSLTVVPGIPPPVFHLDLTDSHFIRVPGPVHDGWELDWWFDCSNTDSDTGNFIVELQVDDGLNAVVLNELTAEDHGAMTYAAGGDVAFQVISECAWGLTVY